MAEIFKVGPVPVERDENGFWMHPDIPWDDVPEDESVFPFLEKWGFKGCFATLEDDAPQEMADRYFDSGDADCSYWNPTPPEDEGWFLAGIYDTEDGPCAMFLKAV